MNRKVTRMTTRTDIVRAHFHDRFGQWPTLVFRAPGRVTLIGDHTDYQQGRSLAMAVPMATWAACTPRADQMIQAGSAHEHAWFEGSVTSLHALAQGPRPLTGWSGLLAAVWDVLPSSIGANIWVESNLTVGAGLSSSAAVTLALLAALNAVADRPLAPSALPSLGQRVENEYLGVPSGILDQLSIVMAQPRSALVINAAARTALPVAFPYPDAGYRVWIIDTQSPRTLQAAGYTARVREAAAAAEALGVANLGLAGEADWSRIPDSVLRRRARHILTENARVLATVDAAAHNRWAHVMALFNDSHASLAEDYEVSTPRLDLTAARIRQLGIGVRVTGAGFGGSLVAIGPSAREPELTAAVSALYHDEHWPDPVIRPIAYPAGGLEQVGG